MDYMIACVAVLAIIAIVALIVIGSLYFIYHMSYHLGFSRGWIEGNGVGYNDALKDVALGASLEDELQSVGYNEAIKDIALEAESGIELEKK